MVSLKSNTSNLNRFCLFKKQNHDLYLPYSSKMLMKEALRTGTRSFFSSKVLYYFTLMSRGAKQGGGVGGVSTPLNFGWGVEHLSTPPDFEKKFFRGGWLPLN